MFPVVKKKDCHLVNGVQGKRRLGRFPVSSSSVIVKTTNNASTVDKDCVKINDQIKDNLDMPDISFSPLSGSIDSSLLCEIEKVESVINNKRTKSHLTKNACTEISSRSDHVNEKKHQLASSKEAVEKENSKVLDAKRKHSKMSYQCPSSSSNFDSCDSPTNSPRDKKPKQNLSRVVTPKTNILSVGQTQKINIDSCFQTSPNSSVDQVSEDMLESRLRPGKLSTSTTLESTNGFHQSIECLNLTEDKRLLSSWGLPEPVLDVYKKQGISTMFEWQAECLLTGNALGGDNLVYSAPTSAGKTLVAELLVLKKVLETKKKAVVILPFVAVAREKMYQLQSLYQDIGVRVGGFMGSNSPSGGLSHVDIAVCTIEKANGLLNRLMEEGRINEIGIVVVDELHMVGDSHRGYLLELMLTKLMYLTRKTTNEDRVQIVGMSATLPNLRLLADWLKASLYCTAFRPVPLTEYVKVDNKILDSDLIVQREIPASLTFPNDQDHVVALCLETVTAGHAVLIFCPTKAWCENLCEAIARHFFQILQIQNKQELEGMPKNSNGVLSLCLDKSKLEDTIEQLKRSPAGVDPMLGKCIMNGVAYHHAGLTFDEREIIEGAFKETFLKVLVATSTLSSGVNLPAQRVLIRTPMFHGQVIDSLTYKQMSGRAGRRGVDKFGESILMCKPQEKTKGQNLIKSALPNVESCLRLTADQGLNNCLKRAILEVVVSGAACSYEDVLSYIDCSLLSVSLRDEDLDKMAVVESCIQYLHENEFISVHIPPSDGATGDGASKTKKFFSTQLGVAIFASSLSPEEGLQVFAELQKARKSFVLDTDLHLIYLVTPVYAADMSNTIDWYKYHAFWEALSPADKRVAQLVGVSEAFIGRAIKGSIPTKTVAQKKSLAVHLRFYTALILNSLIQETPLYEVSAKFNCNKGQLQSLQQSVSTYAGMMTVLCGKLGWYNLELLLSHFQTRLSSGVQQELVDLVRIQSLNACSARMLFNAGYQTVADVAKAEVIDVANLFKKAVPFQSEKKEDGETDWEQRERTRAKCIWLTGRKGVTEMEAATAIIQEAKIIIQDHLGVPDIHWSTKEDDSSDSLDVTDVVSENENVHEAIGNELECEVIVDSGSSNGMDYREKNDQSGVNKNDSLRKSRSYVSLSGSRKMTGNISMIRSRRISNNVSIYVARSQKKGNRQKSFYGHVVISPPVGVRMDRTLQDTSVIDQNSICQTSGHRVKDLIHVNISQHSSNAVNNILHLTLCGGESSKESLPTGYKLPQTETNSPKNHTFDEDNFEESIILDTQTENLIHLHCPATGTIQPSLTSKPGLRDHSKSSNSQEHLVSGGENSAVVDGISLFSESFSFSRNKQTEDAHATSVYGAQLIQAEPTHHIEAHSSCYSSDAVDKNEHFSRITSNATPTHSSNTSTKVSPDSSICLISSACEAANEASEESLIAASNFDKYGDIENEASDCSHVDNSDTSELRESHLNPRQMISSASKSLNSVFDSPLDENIFLASFTQDEKSSPACRVQKRSQLMDSSNSSLLYSTPKILENSRRLHKVGLAGKENLNLEAKNSLKQKFKALESFDNVQLSDDMFTDSLTSSVLNKLKTLEQAPPANCGDDIFTDSLSSSVLDKVQAECDHLMEEANNSVESSLSASLNEHQSEHSLCLESNHPSALDMNVTGSDNSDCIPPTPPNVEAPSPFKVCFQSPPRLQISHSSAHFSKLVSSPRVSSQNESGQCFTKLRSKSKVENLKLNTTAVDAKKAVNLLTQSGTVSQSLTQQSFTIIDVCANQGLFETFLNEWAGQSSYALAIACDRRPPELKSVSGPTIGGKFAKKSKKVSEIQSESVHGLPVPESDCLLVGVAISWENRDSYFISLMPDGYKGDSDANDTLKEPELDSHLTQKFRIDSICKVLDTLNGTKRQKVAIYDAKTVYKYLATTLGVSLLHCEDPRIADWLREPTSRLKNLHRMTASHCPEELALLDCIGGMQGYQSLGVDIKSSVSPRIRACTECVLTMKLMTKYRSLLAEDHLLSAFTDIEMPSLITLTRMELNGFGISSDEIERQKTLMLAKLTALEEKAYSLAGHVFSLTSTEDVAKVLYIELRLPVNGEPVKANSRLASARGRSPVRSTSKETLEKLEHLHPLPSIVLEWRRLSSALSKSLFALQKSVRPCVKLHMGRVFGDCQLFTATGRVSMAEPNLQNIPKDFSCKLSDLLTRSSSNNVCTTREKTSKQASKMLSASSTNESVIAAPISMRSMFIPFAGGLLLAADYCQLELRIFAHLCADPKLSSVLNTTGVDVFNMIAAEMKSVDVDHVTTEFRQQAKQVCYGMLYGIGAKALGQKLEVDENDAHMFMETFKNKYLGIKKYLKETIEFCQKNGFVKTIFNRRRYLPSIKSQNIHIRAQAERQAVNTTIQGSAADLVKIAMVNIDKTLSQLFPSTQWSHTQVQSQVHSHQSSRSKDQSLAEGGYLVLQLHDELIYEVSSHLVPEVARIIKKEMETAIRLNVCLPVKIKVGPSWGQLKDYQMD
ncbi:DNA polymerase theta-like [Biomphalaria glabrata]|uniref:DNA polymerase theta n=1 Tax=Biomphalaria glabrata TaxID=6526 RepID=A0A9W3AR56_BIOGL|nr:DNA polymerase theta-like [Biomphalaria glabrata]